MSAEPKVVAGIHKKFRFGDSSCPILYEDGRVRIYKNHCNEIFVEDVKSGTTIRINSYGYLRGGLEFTTDGRVEPTIVNNVIGWRVSRR